VKLVADANVLLSASIGGRARGVLMHPTVEEVLTTPGTLAEVQEYLGSLARKRGLPLDAVLLSAAALPVTVVERTVFAAKMRDATRRLGQRDPDDVELLALALCTGFPVWSNDKDFESAGVEWFTTADLLKRLGPSR
jgi:predicted nucleic acid-binding protein